MKLSESKKLRGLWGEQQAAAYLKRRGYRIVGQNYTCRFGEIDVIAADRKYVAFVEDQQKTMLLQREIEAINEKYPDMPQEAVKELAKSRAAEKERKNAETAAARKKEQDEAAQKPWMDFLREFPEYKDELPNDVVAYIEKGSSPVEAMLRFKLDEQEAKYKELEQKLNVQAQNEKTKKQSVGSVESTATKPATDAFLAGFGT